MTSPAAASPSRWGSAFFAFVGVALFLGFGAGLVSRVMRSVRAPAGPTPTSGAALASEVREGWVELGDAIVPCTYPPIPSGSSSATYRVLVSASAGVVGLVEASSERCDDPPHALRGTLRVRTLEDLALPADAAAFLRAQRGEEEVRVLWAGDSPHLELGEAAIWGVMAALGLVIAWFYAAAFFVRAAKVRLPPCAHRPGPPLLPARPLQLARAYRATPLLAIAFFGVCAVMFGVLTVGQLADGAPLDVFTIGIIAFLGTMTLVLVALLAVTVRAALRGRPAVEVTREAWAELVRHEVLSARGVDVGNRALAFRDPFVGAGEPERIVELVVGANEGLPWVVDGHVLVVRAEPHATLYVLREDGGPFDLRDAEIERIVTRAR